MTTRNLVQNHVKVIYHLDSRQMLQGNRCNFIILPFESNDKSIYQDLKRSGKHVLTNEEGNVVQYSDINVERAIKLSIDHDVKTKTKTIKVENNDQQPNVVFFRLVDGMTNENAALVTDISFQLWYLIKTKQLSNKQLQQLLKKLTAVLLAHTKKSDMPAITKTLLYTNPDNGEFLAPLAVLQDNIPKQVLEDFKIVIETGDLPETVQPVTQEQFTSMRRAAKDYKNRALGDLREAVYEAQTNRHASKRAQDILKKYFNMNAVQALDLLQLNARSDQDENIDLAEDLINNTLRYVAQDNVSTVTAEDAGIISEQLVEAFSNRLA